MELDITTMDPDERDRRARAFFRDGYNCCQSVLMAFQDITGLSGEQTATLSSGFGGGMGRLREVCGSVSAMTFMAGFISPAVNPGNMDERTANYALVQEFASAFRERHGSIVCKDILQLRAQQKQNGNGGCPATIVMPVSGTAAETQEKTTDAFSPRPSERTAEFYTKRPCERCIGDAARIIAEKLAGGKN